MFPMQNNNNNSFVTVIFVHIQLKRGLKKTEREPIFVVSKNKYYL